jgi:hypothetical protein
VPPRSSDHPSARNFIVACSPVPSGASIRAIRCQTGVVRAVLYGLVPLLAAAAVPGRVAEKTRSAEWVQLYHIGPSTRTPLRLYLSRWRFADLKSPEFVVVVNGRYLEKTLRTANSATCRESIRYSEIPGPIRVTVHYKATQEVAFVCNRQTSCNLVRNLASATAKVEIGDRWKIDNLYYAMNC